MANDEGLTLTTVTGLGLGIQAWAGDNEPVAEKLLKPSRTLRPASKPHDGFYTLTWRPEDFSTSWVDYMRVHGLERESATRSIWLLVPDPDSSLYVINSEWDYEELSSQYPQRWDPPVRSPVIAPDWNRIANLVDGQIDGIHVISLAASSSWLWGWDVESTLWLRWSFLGEPECIADIGERWELFMRDR